MSATAQQTKYAQDGVDVIEGDSFSRFAGTLCRETYKNSPYVEVRDFSRGHFRGPRAFKLTGLPSDCWMDLAPDGAGTKPVLVDTAGDYDNAAYGPVAMTRGDISRWGGKSLVFVNNLDTDTIGKAGQPVNIAFRRMIVGLQKVCNENRLVMFKGETAELPGCVSSPNPNALAKYLWSAVMFGVYCERTIITGDQVRPGMAVMTLRELGFRDNGISSGRKSLAMRFGSNYYTNPKAQAAIKRAAQHSVLYDEFLETANGWYNNCVPLIPMYLIVHATGGALKGKFAEDILFPRGLSAKLDNLWNPPRIMRECAKWRGMDDEECYETWNGGQGVLTVIDECNVKPFTDLAARFGIQAKRAGKIIKKRKPTVVILSKFTGKKITWHAK